jgi:DNA-directed RNA polymerase subunit RPC12/RpoP
MKHCPNPDCPFLFEHGIAVEYEDRMEKCLDCGTPLVAGPAPRPEKDEPQLLPDLVLIRTTMHTTEADLIKARLEAAGIPVFLKNYETINANWFYANALGWVQVMVREQDAARARQILDEAAGETVIDELPEGDEVEFIDEDVVVCPQCGSTNVHYEKYNYRLSFLSMMLLSMPIPFKKGEWVCDDCGYRWKEEEEDENDEEKSE